MDLLRELLRLSRNEDSEIMILQELLKVVESQESVDLTNLTNTEVKKLSKDELLAFTFDGKTVKNLLDMAKKTIANVWDAYSVDSARDEALDNEEYNSEKEWNKENLNHDGSPHDADLYYIIVTGPKAKCYLDVKGGCLFVSAITNKELATSKIAKLIEVNIKTKKATELPKEPKLADLLDLSNALK